MKIKYLALIIGLLMALNLLNAANESSLKSSVNKLPDYDKYGFMIGYAPTNNGFSAKIYGVPLSNKFEARFSYFSYYLERKGEFKGGEFDDAPLDFWEKEDKEIYRKQIMNLGSIYPLTKNRKLLLAYFVGIGYYQEFEQYKSVYGNYWFENNENKVIADVGGELIGRIGFVNLGLGASLQEIYYLSLGVEF